MIEPFNITPEFHTASNNLASFQIYLFILIKFHEK